MLASSVDRAARNLRVLVRRVLFAVGNGEPLPPSLPVLLDQVEQVFRLLAADPRAERTQVTRALVDLAELLDPQLLGADGLSAAVVVGQLRSAVVDLLEGVGVDPARARSALPPSS